MKQLGREPVYLDVPDIEFETVRTFGRGFAGKGELPSAVLAYSDATAMAFLAGLHEAGIRVPEQMAVMGFDDRRAAALASPPLTTVAQPGYEVGLAAANVLLKKMAGEDAPAAGWSSILPMRIVSRESA